MPRTQAADYDSKRVAIVREAARLFAKYGFAGASLSELAAACHVSKSVLYHYFSSKEDILYAVMSAHMELLLEATDEQLYAEVSEARWFYALSVQLLKRYAGGASAQKVLLYDLDYLGREERKTIIALQRRLVAFAELCLRKAIAPASPGKDTLRAQVMLFFGMINWSHSWFKSTQGLSRRALAMQAADAAVLPLRMAPENAPAGEFGTE